MEIAVSQDGDGTLIRLEGAMDIAGAAELQDALRRALDEKRRLRIDVAGVTDLDVTAWQLLWAAQRDASRRGIECTFAGKLPETLESFLASAGLAPPSAAEWAGSPEPAMTKNAGKDLE